MLKENVSEKIAQIISRNFGIKVYIQGDRAATDGKTIVLPNIPEMESHAHDLYLALILHEAGHVKYTSKLDCYCFEHKLLINAFEDVRVELKIEKQFGGAKILFRNLFNYAIANFVTPDTDENIIIIIMKHIASSLRYKHSLLTPRCIPTWDKISDLVRPTKSYEDSFNLAWQICERLGYQKNEELEKAKSESDELKDEKKSIESDKKEKSEELKKINKELDKLKKELKKKKEAEKKEKEKRESEKSDEKSDENGDDGDGEKGDDGTPQPDPESDDAAQDTEGDPTPHPDGTDLSPNPDGDIDGDPYPDPDGDIDGDPSPDGKETPDPDGDIEGDSYPDPNGKLSKTPNPDGDSYESADHESDETEYIPDPNGSKKLTPHPDGDKTIRTETPDIHGKMRLLKCEKEEIKGEIQELNGELKEINAKLKDLSDTEDEIFEAFKKELDENDSAKELLEELIDQAYTALTDGKNQRHIPVTTAYDKVLKMDPDLQGKNECASATQNDINTFSRVINQALYSQKKSRYKYAQEEGTIDTRSLYAYRVKRDTQIFSKTETKQVRDIAISIAIDCSGSMSPYMQQVKHAGFVLSGTFTNLNINHEIIGFTTKDSFNNSIMKSVKDISRFNRFEELYHLIVKSFDNPDNSAMANLSAMRENVDGESLIWITERLLKRKESRKILIVISDGAPIADCNPFILAQDLKATVKLIEATGVQVIAFGINGDFCKKFYTEWVQLKTNFHADLCKQVFKYLIEKQTQKVKISSAQFNRLVQTYLR
jgi:cobalamin biosynthesis protein CobT